MVLVIVSLHELNRGCHREAGGVARDRLRRVGNLLPTRFPMLIKIVRNELRTLVCSVRFPRFPQTNDGPPYFVHISPL